MKLWLMLMKNIFKIISIFFLPWVAYAGIAQKPDLSDLHPYSTELEQQFQNQEGINPPYAAFFNKQNSQLLYIATMHESDPATETFQLIKSAFDVFSPDFVIVEGIETTRGISPEKIKQHIHKACLSNWNCSESLYAAHLAVSKNVSFIGAEPDDREMFKLLKHQHYTFRDAVFFYFTRQIPQYYKEKKKLSEKDLPKLFSGFISDFIKDSGYTFNDYKIWLKEKLNKEITFQNLIDSELTAPIATGHYLQRLSSVIGVIRDQHILTTILQNLAAHKKVLVIFGHSHYPTQKDVLEKNLGPAVYLSSDSSVQNYFNKN